MSTESLQSPILEAGARPYPSCAIACQARHETDHRVANQLAMLASYVRLRSAEFDRAGTTSNASVRLLTQAIEAQVHAVARLHRLLMRQDSGSAVDLSPLLREICASFRGGPEQGAMMVEHLAPDCAVPADQVLPICQLVGEAIINAMKYAFPASGQGVLTVQVRRAGLNSIAIDVSDNGPGLPAGFDPKTDGGFGFDLMRSVSRGLHAPLLVESSPRGLRVGLVLPSG